MASPNPRTARIVDAGVNRAREGLRVLEDLARFGIDDPDLSANAKELRHALARAVAALPIDAADLLAARDTPADVGTAISTATERTRAGEDDIAAAAAARATEALRSIEEAAKTLGADGSAFERIRYHTYDLERTLRLRLRTLQRQWRLCVLLTESLCSRPWEQVARAAIAGGADCIQLREKDLDDSILLDRARQLRAITAGRAALVINDRPDIALLAQADAVHLGQTDLPIAAVRALSRERLAIGVSCTNIDQARRAARDGADYLGLGPMFATTTKHKPVLAGPALLTGCLQDPESSRVPHLAIGGIGPDNIAALAEVGVRGVAVSAAVCTSPDPERICRGLLAYLQKTDPPLCESNP